ncbi:MAG TPA: histamine H3 receptor [Coriobacteriia bacterium]|nr:histamine H3 receptor [Coriobacteriia bacterium]
MESNETPVDSSDEPQASPEEPQTSHLHKPPKKRRRGLSLLIVGGVLILAFIGAGVGFAVWHEQPGFCNTICHEPMDTYVESYCSESELMVVSHAQAGVTCLQCHKTAVTEQLGEAVAWVKHDFELDANKKLSTVGVTADVKQCGTPKCHDMESVIAVTEYWGGDKGVNPHRSHQGTAIDCSNCHSAHGTSHLMCNTCHEYDLPKNWVNP